ncbi:hypothetical protein [Blastococcus goldschmidtiae]|uniref:Uncharacterized protein n=1 Tax=Blastococcus goldschmidtiae TaxID=3075546 RepID=A0ABU2K2T6_9ACTN|nr:hypothetical protein [Blastococcus sp. DSM 46792]MDT0274506.1 hypothetical protein [Blastococcus sp. DSM 46792]
MTSGPPDQPGTPAGRERLVGLFVLGVAAVLLVSSVTWFGSDQAGVGIAQVICGLVVAAVGGFLVRRARSRG